MNRIEHVTGARIPEDAIKQIDNKPSIRILYSGRRLRPFVVGAFGAGGRNRGFQIASMFFFPPEIKRERPKWVYLTLPFNPSDYQGVSFAGVYAIYAQGSLMYVGQSSDVLKRLKTHGFASPEFVGGDDIWQTPWGPMTWLMAKIKVRGKYGSWLSDEARLIRRARPPFNKNIPNGQQSFEVSTKHYA